MASRSAKFEMPHDDPGTGLQSRPHRSAAGDALLLAGFGRQLYRDYIEHLVRTISWDQVIRAGGEELGRLERHCAGSGQELLDGISPVLDAFFQYVQSASPGIWKDFTCQDAVTLIHDHLGRTEVLSARTADDPARREDAVFGFFLYCSYAFAAAAHGSPDVSNEIGVRPGRLLM